MEKKTILYVGGFELPDKNAAAQRVLSVAKIFRELGFNVVFLGISNEKSSFKSIEESKNNYFGFDSWAINYPKNKKEWIKHLSSSFEVDYLIEKYYKDNLYAVICYNHPFLSQYKIKNSCKKNNAFYIPDATEWYSSKGKGLVFGVIKWLDTTLRMKYIHNKSDGIIATSDYLANYYKKNKRIVLELPSMFDTQLLKNTPISEEVISNDVITLMYAGSPFDKNNPKSARKNIKDRLDKIIILMHEMHKLDKEFIFNIFGLEKDNYLLSFPEHSKILDEMKSKIYFNGKQKHSVIISYIKRSDFTIFLRDIDQVTLAGFPTKFSESLACGTPVITNKISNIEKYLSETNNGFFIENTNLKDQILKMDKIFSLKKDDIDKMKKYCNDNVNIDYRNFISQTKIFVNKLENKI